MAGDTPNAPVLVLPDGFDADAWEIEAKGWFPGAVLRCGDRTLEVTFYDPERLRQDVEADLGTDGASVLLNVVVISRVTRADMESAAAGLAHLFT